MEVPHAARCPALRLGSGAPTGGTVDKWVFHEQK